MLCATEEIGMTTLTIEIPEQIDQQLQVSQIKHEDLAELFLHWVQLYLNSPDKASTVFKTVNTDSLSVESAPKRSLSSFFGAGQGSFSNAEEADAFIRAEREAWTS
jgi:hypothetical protein